MKTHLSGWITPLTCSYSFGKPHSLVHRAHQSKSRLRSLAPVVELDHGLTIGSA